MLKTYVNEGEDEQMEIQGFHLSYLKLVISIIGLICSGGLLGLVFYWRTDWMIRCTHSRCPAKEAKYIILEDMYKEIYTCRVQRQSYASASLSAIKLDDVTTNEKNGVLVPPSGRASVSQPRSKIEIFFKSKKIKYLWDEEKELFERVNIYLLKFTYDESRRQFVSNAPLRCSQFHDMQGLTVAEQAQRRLIYGSNLIRVHVTSIIVLLITQGLNPFYVFQIFSICLWICEQYYWYAGCLGLISILSLGAQTVQQRMSERALKQTITARGRCSVYRRDTNIYDTRNTDILVPGDIIRIPREGCNMYCDAVLLSGNCIVNESMLTGESLPVTKTPIPRSTNDPKFDMKEHSRHVLFCGTHILQTRSFDQEEVRAVVIRTGFDTAKGELVRSIMYPRPVDFKFIQDGYKYVGVLAGIAAVGMIYTLYLTIAVQASSASVTAIQALDLITIVVPPALPAAMTCGIVFAQQRLRKKRIFCISPRTINVSGSIEAFCFDKTGTLTEDGLDLWGIRAAIRSVFQAQEIGRGGQFDLEPDNRITIAMATCHSLTIIADQIVGDPLDDKMFKFTGMELFEMDGSETNDLNTPTLVVDKTKSHVTRDIGILKQFTFTSKLQRMSVITRDRALNGDSFTVYSKGSPEIIRSLAKPETIPADFDRVLVHYTQQGYRVIGLAYKIIYEGLTQKAADVALTAIKAMPREEVECDLIFLGLLIMENRLKPETAPVIRQLKGAKMKLVMVTGDNMLTALSVARECKLIDDKDDVIMVTVQVPSDNQGPTVLYCPVENIRHMKDEYKEMQNENGHALFDVTPKSHRYHFAITGKSWQLVRQYFPHILPELAVRGTVFARFSPDQKQQLIEMLQSLNYYVGMCGDGANDCGALKTAHAGISLSEAEASVASPFTSKDQNISCVPNLIREGRCALVTSFGVFKFMAGYSMTQFLDTCIVYWAGVTLTDFTFLYQDLFLLTTEAISFCLTGPSEMLVPKAPMVSLVSLSPIVSLICIIILNLSVMIFSFYFTQLQPWYLPVDGQFDGPNQCHDVTMIFLFTATHFIVMGVIFSKGPPYRQYIFTNIPYCINILICLCCTIDLIFYPATWFQELLLLKIPPSIAFRAIIFGVCCIHFFATSITETYFVDGFIEKRIQPWLSMKVFGERLKYKIAEAKMVSNPDWPPLSHIPLADIMEAEATTSAAQDLKITTANKAAALEMATLAIRHGGAVNGGFDGAVIEDPHGPHHQRQATPALHQSHTPAHQFINPAYENVHDDDHAQPPVYELRQAVPEVHRIETSPNDMMEDRAEWALIPPGEERDEEVRVGEEEDEEEGYIDRVSATDIEFEPIENSYS